MNLHSFIHQDETWPIGQFRKIMSSLENLSLKNPFELVALSSKMIARVRNGIVESKKRFERKHVSGFKTLKQTRSSKTNSGGI